MVDVVEGICEIEEDQINHVSFAHQKGYTLFLKEKFGQAGLVG